MSMKLVALKFVAVFAANGFAPSLAVLFVQWFVHALYVVLFVAPIAAMIRHFTHNFKSLRLVMYNFSWISDLAVVVVNV